MHIDTWLSAHKLFKMICQVSAFTMFTLGIMYQYAHAHIYD